MRPWHLSTASSTRHAIFPTEALRRRAVLTIARVCRGELVEFCVVDDHVHVIVLCGRARAGVLARALKLALGRLAAVPLKPVYIGTVHGRNHMLETHRYVLRQPAHHGLAGHPALWSGSCLLDLVGARWAPGISLRLREVLPRLPLTSSLETVGLPATKLIPATPEEIRAVGSKALVAAAASACAAAPAVEGRGAQETRARRAACVLGREAGLPPSELAWALRIHRASANKAARNGAEAEALLATRTHLALESAVLAAPPFRLPERRSDGRAR